MDKLNELKKTFEFLSKNEFSGVKGCFCFDSGISGKIIGISILTHGNEPAGLAAFQYFYENKIIPLEGKIIFVLNNIEGAKRYFSDQSDKKDVFRFIDINFNRLPEDTLDNESKLYEIQRIRELYPIYKTFDYGLDIHSTKNNPKAIIISISDKIDEKLFTGFPIEMVDIVSNMANIQKGIPVSKFMGGLGNNIPILGIECGIHEDGSCFETAIKCALQFCKNCGTIKSTDIQEKRNYKNYKVNSSILFPNLSFKVVKDFLAFEEVKKDEVLGIDMDGITIICPDNFINLFGVSKEFVPKNETDEVFFLLDYPEIITL